MVNGMSSTPTHAITRVCVQTTNLLALATNEHVNDGGAVFLDNRVREQLAVVCNRRLVEAPPNQTLHIEKSVGGIQCGLILGGIADQTLAGLRERDVGRRDAVTLSTCALNDCVARAGARLT